MQAVIAGCALVKNAALHRALRRKDQEMNQLILMVSSTPIRPTRHQLILGLPSASGFYFLCYAPASTKA